MILLNNTSRVPQVENDVQPGTERPAFLQPIQHVPLGNGIVKELSCTLRFKNMKYIWFVKREH